MDPRKVRDKIMPALARLTLPPGYSIEFDPAAIQEAEAVSSQAFLFVLALLFCYMVIAAFKESFLFPLAVLAVVPPSLALPALCMASLSVNAAAASAFIAVSGMAVNAAVLVADGIENFRSAPSGCSLYRIVRKRLPLLAATSGTTVAGALPFLFIGKSSASIVSTLSLVAALGVTASVFCSVSLIPALARRFPFLFKPFEPGKNA
jgi:multidrug efflux pump subunit AcrB